MGHCKLSLDNSKIILQGQHLHLQQIRDGLVKCEGTAVVALLSDSRIER